MSKAQALRRLKAARANEYRVRTLARCLAGLAEPPGVWTRWERDEAKRTRKVLARP